MRDPAGGSRAPERTMPGLGIRVLPTAGVFLRGVNTCLRPRDLQSFQTQETDLGNKRSTLVTQQVIWLPGAAHSSDLVPWCCVFHVTACLLLSQASSACASFLLFTLLSTGSLSVENTVVPPKSLCTCQSVCTGWPDLHLKLFKAQQERPFWVCHW